MMTIIDFLFNFIPDIILLGGPFCVFAGMGTGSNTGKLNFKQICSEGGITVAVTESTSSLDITSSGGGGVGVGSILTNKIATGIGTGITPSRTGFWPNSGGGVGTWNTRNIYGVSIIGSSKPPTYNSNVVACSDKRGMIIGGASNYVGLYSYNSVIVNSFNSNLIYDSGNIDSSIILNSQDSQITNGCMSSIINSTSSYIKDKGTSNSTIVNSESSKICPISPSLYGSFNSIFNSECSQISDSYWSSIMSGCFNCLRGVKSGSIFNGLFNCIRNSDTDVWSYANSIVNGVCNRIYCGQFNSNNIFNGCKNFMVGNNRNNIFNGNSIINGDRNRICMDIQGGATCYSSITNGVGNCLKYTNQSTIMGGYCNQIISTSKNSTISSSRCSIICSSEQTSILGSLNSKTRLVENSTIIGGYTSYICNTNQSSIITGTGSELLGYGKVGITILGGYSNKICNSGYSVNVSYKQNCIFGNNPICHNFLHGIRSNTMNRSRFTSIIGGYESNLTAQTLYSSIIGGDKGTMSADSFSSILSGYKNKTSSNCTSLIVGGANNYLCASNNSAILSSCSSVLLNTSNTVLAGSCNWKCSTGSCPFLSNTLYVCQLQMFGTASTSSPFCSGITCTGITTISQIVVCRGIVVSITP
jgi:hypothetical protein